MKRSTTKWMIAAAALAALAGSASAQSLKAEIPFTFHVGSTVMSPGAYRVMVDPSANRLYLLIRNEDTHKGVLARYSNVDVAKDVKARGAATIRFACSGANCALLDLWAGFNGPALQFQTPKEANARIAFVGLTRVAGD